MNQKVPININSSVPKIHIPILSSCAISIQPLQCYAFLSQKVAHFIYKCEELKF